MGECIGKPDTNMSGNRPYEATIDFYCSNCDLRNNFLASESEVQSNSNWDPYSLVLLKVGEKLFRWQERNCPRKQKPVKGRLRIIK